MSAGQATLLHRCVLTAICWLAVSRWASGQAVHEVPVPYAYPEPAWSPYIAGALIGLLAVLTLTISRKPVGASSAYADMAGLLGRLLAPRHISSLNYFQQHTPAISWTLVFIVFTSVGAWLAAWSGGELNGRFLQDLWVARFGEGSYTLRTLLAFVGGAIMAYGARLAGGCTSGHGISGTLQLAVSSWIALLCFFAGGVAVAIVLYRW